MGVSHPVYMYHALEATLIHVHTAGMTFQHHIDIDLTLSDLAKHHRHVALLARISCFMISYQS